MKIFLIACLVVITAGCVKNDQGCKNVSPASEEAQIMAYATANNINATKHNSGIYYQVINPGTGPTPNVNSRIFVNYTGKLMNGTTFEQGSNLTSNDVWLLRQMIEGWQIGLPLIKKGGKIQLLIPSALAYGCNGAGRIPSNAVLFFEIDLVDVQ
jgi:FKBP-type peptidyl-prolyl cis-trans isomerase